MLNVTSVNNSGINGYYVYEATTKDNLDKCSFNFQDSAYVSQFGLYKYADFDPYR